MRRNLLLRILGYWAAFGVGSLVGAWVVGAHPGSCSTQVIELSADQLTQAVQSAVPAAVTGSGQVEFKIDVTGIHIHADSMLNGQTFDTTLPAVVRGSPITLDVSTRVLTQITH